MGFSIAMDDFGTGYSSLNYLTFLRVDMIKLDKNLLDGYETKRDAEIIRNIILLAHELNMEVVAEGIEERQQHELITLYDSDYAQGYLYSKPIEDVNWGKKAY
jgi:EAL domain-containing protein (putative c-di-GMP-specific phosphodiesterase class I)